MRHRIFLLLLFVTTLGFSQPFSDVSLQLSVDSLMRPEIWTRPGAREAFTQKLFRRLIQSKVNKDSAGASFDTDSTLRLLNGVLSGQMPTKDITGTSYTVIAADKGFLLNTTNSSLVTITFPSGLPKNFYVGVRKGGAGHVRTVAGGGATIETPSSDTLTTFRQTASVIQPSLNAWWGFGSYGTATSGGGGSGTVNSGAANTLAYYPSSGTTIDDLTAITTNRALASNASGLPVASSTTATELGYVSGVTSSVQSQLDDKQRDFHRNTLGTIINETWASTSAWTANPDVGGSPGASVSGGKVSFTTGSGNTTLNKFIYSNYGNSNLSDVVIETSITVGTINGTSYGEGFGFQNFVNAASVYYGLQVLFSLDASALGLVTLYNNNVGAVNSTTRFTAAAGDVLNIVIRLTGNRIISTVKNVTTSLDYTFDFDIPTTYPLSSVLNPSSYRYSIYHAGGNHQVGPFVVRSYDEKNADFLFLGNSQTKTSYSVSTESLFPQLFAKGVNAKVLVNAGAGISMEWLNTSEILALTPRKIIIEGWTNNIARLDNTTVYATKLQTLINTFTSAGYVLGTDLFVCTVLPRNSVDVAPYNTAIKTLVGTTLGANIQTSIIDVHRSFLAATGTGIRADMEAGDGLHLNYYKGHPTYAAILLNFFRNSTEIKSAAATTAISPTYDASGNFVIGPKPTTSAFKAEFYETNSRPQIKIGYSAAGVGNSYIRSVSGNMEFGTGAYYNGSNYIADGTTASFMSLVNGAGAFYNNTGLTNGSSFTPAVSAFIDTDRSWNFINGFTNSQIKIGNGFGSYGGSITATSTGAGGIGFGMAYISSNYRASSTAASLLNFGGGGMALYLNTGLTIGSNYTPTQKFVWGPDGNCFNGGLATTPTGLTNGYVFGLGTAPSADVTGFGGGFSMWCQLRNSVTGTNGMALRVGTAVNHIFADLVGIGTLLPQSGLHVTRSIRSDSLNATQSGVAGDAPLYATTGGVIKKTASVAGIYGGTGQTTTSVGDILVGAASNTWSKLAIGASGTYPRSNGTALAYSNFTTDVQTVGDVRYEKSLASFYTDAATPASTTQTDLYSYTVPAGQLATNGDRLTFETTYALAVNLSTTGTTLEILFGGTSIFSSGSFTLTSNSSVTIKTTIIRVSSSVVRYSHIITLPGASSGLFSGGGTTFLNGEVTGLTLSGTNILKCTGQGGTGAAAGDITAKMGFINYLGN
jgi:hypothetical protein